MTHAPQPPATMSRMKACRSGAWRRARRVEGAVADAIRDRAHQAALHAGCVEDCADQKLVVVLPLVPVMPTTRISRLG